MKTKQLREQFLAFFADKGHQVVPSSSLVPVNDQSLLFTNAGMVQFKDIFLGNEQRSYHRAVTVQRCVRAGGKHNDLENVGYTARHHTFFEMLGNFSFGDYFKREAIQYAWEFLTKILNLPEEKLWVTVFRDDEEAANIWLNEMGVSGERFSRCGESDNFWAMGDTGPCGPCSEIFYDHGPEIPGGPPGSPEQEGDRYIEIWNLVFMQFNRTVQGELIPLPRPSVDTGMGLERIAAVLQGVHNNYEIDLFQQLIQAARTLLPQGVEKGQEHSLKVIADHIRSCAFLIADGVIPANEGRGYVLRRIIRRAVRHGNQLGMPQPFFYRLVPTLIEEMGEAYPELIHAQSTIVTALQQEEEQFAKTLEQGLKILAEDLAHLAGPILPGELIFRLYDTYGFPFDLTGDIARERGLTLDVAGFEKALAQQRYRSRVASQFTVDYANLPVFTEPTEFCGYDTLETSSRIIGLIRPGGEVVESLAEHEEGIVILDRSPFYAEGGGQVGDQGQLMLGKTSVFNVQTTTKQQQVHFHFGTMQEGQSLHLGMSINAKVEESMRRDTMRHHSATHLLHAALREQLDLSVQQKGSLVEAERLRFDFAYPRALTSSELLAVEKRVNAVIRQNHAVITDIMDTATAQASGAVALFGEKYGENVRVLSMGDFSKELCGGTHVKQLGDIGYFKIISEVGIAAGIRRIEAVAGEPAESWVRNYIEALNAKIDEMEKDKREFRKQLDKMRAQAAITAGNDLAAQAEKIQGVSLLITQLHQADNKSLRDTLDQLKNKLQSAVIILVNVIDNRVQVVAGMTKDCVGRVPSARELVIRVCGKGGGRDDLAEGGNQLPTDLPQRLMTLKQQLIEMLK